MKNETEMDKKEKWANEVLGSLEGMKRAEPNSDLFEKIRSQLPQDTVPLKRLTWWSVAACLLVSFNLYVFTNEIKTTDTTDDYTSVSYETKLLTNYSLYHESE